MKKVLIIIFFIIIIIGIFLFYPKDNGFKHHKYSERKEVTNLVTKIKAKIREKEEKPIESFSSKELFNELERSTLEDRKKIKECNDFLSKNVIEIEKDTYKYKVNDNFIHLLLGKCLFYQERTASQLALLQKYPEKFNEIIKTQGLDKDEIQIFEGLKAFVANSQAYDEGAKSTHWTYITVQLAEENISRLQLSLYASLVRDFLRECQLQIAENIHDLIQELASERMEEMRTVRRLFEFDAKRGSKEERETFIEFSKNHIAKYKLSREYQARFLEVIRIAANDVRKCIEE